MWDALENVSKNLKGRIDNNITWKLIIDPLLDTLDDWNEAGNH